MRPASRARRCGRATLPSRVSASAHAPPASSASQAIKIGLNRFGRRGLRGDFVGEPQRFFRCAAASGKLRFEHANRPLVPEAGLCAVAAVGLARLPQVVAGRFIPATHQRDLRERVVHGAGDLVELRLAARLQRAEQNLFGALELAEPHENLTERRERNREPAPGPVLFLQRRALFGQRERLLVAVLNQRDVRLIVAR